MNNDDTIHGLFEKHAKSNPDHIAILENSTSLTYQELNEKANQLAHYLNALDLQPETPVAICLERSISLLVVILGILKAGGVYVLLDPNQPVHRLRFTLEDNQHPMVITSSLHKKRFRHDPSTLIILDEKIAALNEQPTSNLTHLVAPHQLAYIIYTSGSTGVPKGVMIEHRSVVNYAHFFAHFSSCQHQQRIDFSSNVIFDMAVTCSIVPLMLGLTVIICPDHVKKAVGPYLKHLAHHNINLIKITPTYFKTLIHAVDHHHIDLPHVVALILGGENLSTADCANWLELYPEHVLFNEYGPTEATVAVSHHQISPTELASIGSSIPIGNPGSNMEWHLLNEHLSPIANNDVGELYIGGPCLARGYLNQPELTEKKFIQNPMTNYPENKLYKTGDLCKRLANGELEYLGRIDNQIKIRGYRVEPGEIEKTLAAHPVIQDVAVLARKDEHDEKLVAYYILKEGATSPTLREIQAFLEVSLPDYMIPQAFVGVHAFPLTPNGKLDPTALPIPRYTTNQHYQPPKSMIEKTLVKLWSKELDITLIGIQDNFFELGGHSLIAARIMSQINHQLGKEISLAEFYEAATIKKLALLVSHLKTISSFDAERDTLSTDHLTSLPLSDFQLLLWLSTTFAPKAKRINIVQRKRFRGRLDPTALNHAFGSVLKKHEGLFCHILSLRPEQLIQKNLPFDIIEIDLSTKDEKTTEFVLNESIHNLINHYPWKKNKPMIRAILCQLRHEESELQIGMPHMISDDVSTHILLSDLSEFYLRFKNASPINEIKVDTRYREYHLNQQNAANERANRDMIFWDHYLSDASLLALPPEHIVKNMKASGLPYSTYIKIPEQDLLHFQHFCANHAVSLHDGLCAALGLALCQCRPEMSDDAGSLFMNMVKSTRCHHHYDDTIGCFLHLEPIKVSLSKTSQLLQIAKQIHHATIETAPFQRCSGLVKLASVSTFRKKQNQVKRYMISTLIYLYTLLLPTPYLDRKTLNLSKRLMNAKKSNHFVLNVNVQKSILSKIQKHKPIDLLFGLKTKKTKANLYDLLEIDQVLDVCFLRDETHHLPYIVLSANITLAFREHIGKSLLQIIHQETLRKSPEMAPKIEEIAP
ncbi:MAG: amino acid adenylation domain-containing protein [Legionellales bacterium]|nr:amino acid adenylation domain-containing protein [Legionellales bacterium]